jgi:hypothetical protein
VDYIDIGVTEMDTDATQMGAEELDLASAFETADGDAGGDAGGTETEVETDHTPVEGEGEGEEGGEGEGEGAEGEGADSELELDLTGDEQSTVVPIKDDQKVVLVIDGQNVETTFGQMKADAQKVAAAEKRFTEAAQIRKDAEQKLAILPEREKQLGQVLEYYIGQSQQFMQQQAPDWAKLLEENPTEYLKQRHAWEQKQTELNQARGIQQELQRRDAEARQASAQRQVDEERQRLLEVLPEWRDPAKAAQGARELDQYLDSQGVPPEMRAQIDTAKVLLIARKAMLYDRAMAKQAAARANGVKKNQVAARTVERPGAAQVPATTSQKVVARRANAEKAFKQNPSVDTLSSFFE